MASGIKDKVAILGMGCSKFGERWDASPADLMVEAFEEGLADAGIDKSQIQMAWFGAGIDAFNVGSSAMPLSIALRLPNIPATKVENMCATGTEAFRGAVYAVASGACDIALALGVEKLKFKSNVRRLKALGLTESLEVGYRLSPRGQAWLDRVTASA